MWNVILASLVTLVIAMSLVLVGFKQKKRLKIHGNKIKKTLNNKDYPLEAKVIVPIQLHLIDSNSLNLFPSVIMQCGTKSYVLSENDIDNFIVILKEAKEHVTEIGS